MNVVEETGGLIREPIITICELSDYAHGLDEQEKRQYVEKLVKCEIDCLFFIPQQTWVVEAVVIEKLCPSFTEHDIYVYLVAQRSNDTGHQLRAFKSMEESNAMVEHGWVTKLSAIKIRTGSVIFKARVKHSMNFNSQPDLNTWGGFSKDGTIMACHCTCTAGLGGVCTHIGGLLYSVLNLISTPCTSKENSWICSRKNIPADLKTSISELKCSKRTSPTAEKKHAKYSSIQKMNEEEKYELNQILLKNRAVQLHVVDKYCDNFVPQEIPVRLISIYNPDFANGKNYEEIVEECDRLQREVLFVTAEQAIQAEKLTLKQRKSHFWLDIRIGYCTGSLIYQICHTNLSKLSISLIKRICFPGKQLSTPAINYGIENEGNSIKKVLAFIKKRNLHPGFVTAKAGFVIYTEQQGLAASPDGYFTCPCHGKGVIEAKCVWSHRLEKLSEVAVSNKDFFLTYQSGDLDYNFSLNKKHPYYYQAQAEMLVTGTTFCVFVTYTDVDIGVALVTPDKDVFEEIRIKSALFYSKVLLPQMLAEWFVKTKYQPTTTSIQILEEDDTTEDAEVTQEREGSNHGSLLPISLGISNILGEPSTDLSQPSTSNTSPNGTTLYSCCREVEGTGPTVVCSNNDCLISVYHRSCVKPPRVRFGKTWKCKSCTDLMKKRTGKRSIGKENSENSVVQSKVNKVDRRGILKPKN